MDWIYFVVLGFLIIALITLLLFVKRVLDREDARERAEQNITSPPSKVFAVNYIDGFIIEGKLHPTGGSSVRVEATSEEEAIEVAKLVLEQREGKNPVMGYMNFRAKEIIPSAAGKKM